MEEIYKRSHKKKLMQEIKTNTDQIENLYNKAKQIRKLHYIQNTILMSGAYHEKEKEAQMERVKRTASDEEIDFINNLWDKRHELTNELLKNKELFT